MKLNCCLAALAVLAALTTVCCGAPALVSTSTEPSFRLESCDDSLQDYAAFHTSSRGQPGAKYLVYSCTAYSCAGLGDRLRATLLVLQVAIITQRVMLVDWTFPSPLAHYLAPNLLNWTPDLPELLEPNRTLPLRWFRPHDNTTEAPWHKPDFAQAVDAWSVVRISTNDFPWQLAKARSLGAQMKDTESKNAALACMFNMLYKASPLLEAALQKELQAMFGRAQPGPYVAIHLRLGGLAGESNEIKRHDKRDIDVLASALSHAHQLADSKGIDVRKTPIAFITDNHSLRWLLHQKYLSDVVAPTAKNAAHLDQLQHKVEPGSDLTTKFLPEFVEVLILARASCILHTRSGFSRVAVWWANHNCDIDMSLALKLTAAKMEAEVVAESLGSTPARHNGNQTGVIRK